MGNFITDIAKSIILQYLFGFTIVSILGFLQYFYFPHNASIHEDGSRWALSAQLVELNAKKPSTDYTTYLVPGVEPTPGANYGKCYAIPGEEDYSLTCATKYVKQQDAILAQAVELAKEVWGPYQGVFLRSQVQWINYRTNMCVRDANMMVKTMSPFDYVMCVGNYNNARAKYINGYLATPAAVIKYKDAKSVDDISQSNPL